MIYFWLGRDVCSKICPLLCKFRILNHTELSFYIEYINVKICQYIVLGRSLRKLWENKFSLLVNCMRYLPKNKRPLGLTAPLSNNTLSMIYNPMNTKWPWFDLSMPPKVKCHDVSWKTIYRIWFTMCSWKIVYDAPFRRYNLLKSCDLDSTLKMYLMSNVLR